MTTFNDDNNNLYSNDIFHKDDMIIPSNGYSLNSALSMIKGGGKKNSANVNASANANANASANASANVNANKVSEEFNNIAIPASLYYMDRTFSTHSYIQQDNSNNEIISDDLYNKLISLAEDEKHVPKKFTKKRTSEKKKLHKKRKTRRNK